MLDAGSSLLGAWVSLASDGRVTIEGMNAMGYDAMGVGLMEGLEGLDVLLDRRDEAGFPILSANLTYVEGGALVLEPYAILERDGVRYGFLGLTGPEFTQGPGLAAVVAVGDPTEAAARYVPELRARVDVLIVLSTLGKGEDNALAAAVPGIDVIVGSKSAYLMQEPDRAGDTVIVQQGYLGEWLGRTHLRYDAEGALAEASTEAIALTEDYPDDPDLAALVSRYNALHPTPAPVPLTPSPTSKP